MATAKSRKSSCCFTLSLRLYSFFVVLLLVVVVDASSSSRRTATSSPAVASAAAVDTTLESTARHHHRIHHHHNNKPIGRGDDTTTSTTATGVEKRVKKRSKWPHQQSTTSTVMQQQQQSTPYFNKDGSFLKRIVTEVIAERDAQIAAALFEVAKNQPHLQMMVQTLGELSQSNQRLELSSTRLDETQRRLDSRLGVISEKMTLLESRLGQTERRIEREMTHIHGKMDDVFRNFQTEKPDSLMRGVKQIHDQLNSVEEMLMVQPLPPLSANQISSRQQQHHGGKNQRNAKNPISASDLHKLGSSLSQAIASVQIEVNRVVREAENNIQHQISMLVQDNGVFSCAISRLLDLMPAAAQLQLQHSPSSARTVATTTDALDDEEEEEDEDDDTFILTSDGGSNNNATRQQQQQLLSLQGNSIQTADLLNIDQLMAGNGTKCTLNLKCP